MSLVTHMSESERVAFVPPVGHGALVATNGSWHTSRMSHVTHMSESEKIPLVTPVGRGARATNESWHTCHE